MVYDLNMLKSFYASYKGKMEHVRRSPERTASDGVCRQRPYTGQKDTGPAESRKESHR